MGRQYFDDGSWIETDDSGTTYAANTLGSVVSKVTGDGSYYQSASYWTDARETAKVDAYVAAPSGDTRPWWDRAAEYGITRAIDNHFGPVQSNKTSQPATFAGQNGQTYSQVGSTLGVGGIPILPLILAGVAALFALG